MIYVAAADACDFSADDIKINETVKKRIEKSSSEGEKKLRAVAYHALFLLLERFVKDGFCSIQNLELFYTGEGKPFFQSKDFENNSLQNPPSISVSHDKNLAIAVISDSERIGVDVQGAALPKRRMERVAARFFSPIKNVEKAGRIKDEIKWFSAKGAGLSEKEVGKDIKELGEADGAIDFLAKWTKLEAVIKASGGGFLDYPNLEELLSVTETKAFVLSKDKEEYVVTVAK